MRKTRIPDLSSEDIDWLNQALNHVIYKFSPQEAISPLELHQEVVLGLDNTSDISKTAKSIASQMGINRDIKVVYIKDLRDASQTPYQSAEQDFISDYSLDEDKEEVILILANHLKKHARTLLYRILLELTRVQMEIKGMDRESDEQFTDESFLQFALTYQGYGPLIWECGWKYGVDIDQFWVEHFDFRSEVPKSLFMAMVGFVSALTNYPVDWGKWYSEDLFRQLKMTKEEATLSLQPALRNSYALKRIYDKVWKLADERAYSKAIDKLKAVLKETTDPKMRAFFLNDIGYYLQLDGKHSESVQYFENSIKMDPDFPYAYNNLGFAFLILGGTEDGLEFTEIAHQMEGSEAGFAFRNLALYAMINGEMENAEKLFQKAYQHNAMGVEYLDALYVVYLNKQGQIDKANELERQVEYKGIPGELELLRNSDFI